MSIADLKHAVDLTHPRRAGKRFPAELRQELSRHIRQARSGGVSWTTLAAPPRLVPVLAGHTEYDPCGVVRWAAGAFA